MSDLDDNTRRHSACDECRKRKLRCSGQPTGCTGCVKRGLTCQYSIQKQMGRPRKKRKVSYESGQGQLWNTGAAIVHTVQENGSDEADQLVWNELQLVDQNLSSNSTLDFTRYSYTQSIQAPVLGDGTIHQDWRSSATSVNNVDSDVTPPTSSPPTPPLISLAESFHASLDSTNDFIPSVRLGCQKAMPPTNLSFAISTPPASRHYIPVNPSSPPLTDYLPAVPSCTCLADLYLNLSDLSSLRSLPINPHTVETLQAATRTAHTVLYCPICPRSFQGGMQNVMLLGTLLTVIGHGWSRLLRAPAKDLARGFDVDPTTSLTSHLDLASSWSDAQETQWRRFAHYLIRQYVFGDAPPLGVHLPGICPFLSASDSPPRPPIILQNLCNAMERRQMSWHGLIEATGEFSEPINGVRAWMRHSEGDCSEERHERSTGQMGNESKEHLCISIVQTVKNLLASMVAGSAGGCMGREQIRLETS